MIKNIKSLIIDENYFYQITQLYSNFSSFDFRLFDYNKLQNIIKNLPNNHLILFYLDSNDNIIAGITLIIEQKLIHNGKCVGHIEDFVVLKEYRNKGYGEHLLNHAKIICEQNNCYKIILDCSPLLESYYDKKGFTKKGSYMALYF